MKPVIKWLLKKKKKKQDKKTVKKEEVATSASSNNGYIKISATDSNRTLLINVKLEAKEFSHFYCKNDHQDLGINLNTFYKLIKNTEKEDTLTLQYNEEDEQNLIIKVSNSIKGRHTINKLKLMELDKNEIKIPATKFDAQIIFNALEFHNICKEMSGISECIEIKCTKKSITFSCKGDSSEKSTVYCANENGTNITFTNSDSDIIQGIFELKYLILLQKYSHFSDDIQIFVKNAYPLCILYNIANLGHMKFCLIPLNTENYEEYNDDVDNEYEDTDVKAIE